MAGSTRSSSSASPPPGEGGPLPSGLVYVAADMPGLTRVLRGKSFRFRKPNGSWVTDADEITRIRAEGVDREIFTLCKNEKYGQLIENLENVEDSASQMADFALSGQTVAQQITMLAGLTAEDADAALQHILSTDRMAVMDILPDGTAPLAENEEEAE